MFLKCEQSSDLCVSHELFIVNKGQGQGQGQGGQISTYQIIYFVKAHDTHHHLTNRQGGQRQGGRG